MSKKHPPYGVICQTASTVTVRTIYSNPKVARDACQKILNGGGEFSATLLSRDRVFIEYICNWETLYRVKANTLDHNAKNLQQKADEYICTAEGFKRTRIGRKAIAQNAMVADLINNFKKP